VRHNEKKGSFLVVKKPLLNFLIIFLNIGSLFERIFFAGEATAGAYGTVHGANRSGIRAATDVFISDALD